MKLVIKTITWRIIASLITVIVVYMFTREMLLTGIVGALDAVIKTVAYYLHERLWLRI